MIQSASSSAIIYQDDLVIISHSFDIEVPGYLIISPVRHIKYYYELNADELAKLTKRSQQVMKIIAEFTGVENVYMLSFGELTKHFHFHLFPRYTWMDQQINATNDAGVLDGALFFSEARKIYKSTNALTDPKVVSAIKMLIAKLAQ